MSEQFIAQAGAVVEMGEQIFGVLAFKVVMGLFALVALMEFAVAEISGPAQLIDVVAVLQVHGEALDTIGDFAHHRIAGQAADLLGSK